MLYLCLFQNKNLTTKSSLLYCLAKSQVTAFHFDLLVPQVMDPFDCRQIKYDCEFLEAEGIMDYSFLLGIHIEGPHEGYLHYYNPPCFLQSHFSIILNLW